MGTDPQGYAYLGANILRFFNRNTGETVTFESGIGAFEAYASHPTPGGTMHRAVGAGPFSSATVNLNTEGLTKTKVNGFQAGSNPKPPMEVFRVYPWLQGSKDQSYAFTLHFNTITMVNVSGTEIPQNADATKTFRRGDANGNGEVNITDALFIAQHLAGIRSLGETSTTVNQINAASPRMDSQTMGCGISIQDAMFIAQMLAGLRDTSYNLIP